MNRRNSSLRIGIGLLFFALTLICTDNAWAQAFTVIHNFTGGNDGSVPMAGLSLDNAGNLYGTASSGGTGLGTVFRLSNRGGSWVLTPLYNFSGGENGGRPMARVIIGPNGSLYGTTSQARAMGGCSGDGSCGTVFNLGPGARAPNSALAPWTETVLYRFQGGTDGANPSGDVIFDRAGNLYGTTQYGGDLSDPCELGGPGTCGTVYELIPSNGGWTERVLHRFNSEPDGNQPRGGVIFDNAGNLYGTTAYFFPGDYLGTVFQLTPSGSGWTETILFTFPAQGSYGLIPVAGLIFDNSGNLYGATTTDPSVFKLTPSGGSWSISLLHSFTSNNGPYASLLMDAAGDLYGTTVGDGPYQEGTVFKLSPSGDGYSYTSLHDFTGGSDGGLPYSSLVMDGNGNLYGTASRGGTNNAGVVFQVSP